MVESVSDSPYCLVSAARVLQENTAIFSFYCCLHTPRSQIKVFRLCLPPKATLHLAAEVIKQLSAPFPRHSSQARGSSAVLGPREVACAARGAEAAQRADRAGVNAGREKRDFSFPWQQAAPSAQARNTIIPTALSKEGLYPTSTLPQENCSVLN